MSDMRRANQSISHLGPVFAGLVALLGVSACSESANTPPGDQAGMAGMAAGAAGSAGDATAGLGGQSTAGANPGGAGSAGLGPDGNGGQAGSVAGSAGSSGTAGQGGAAGEAGEAGAAGSSGAGAPEDGGDAGTLPDGDAGTGLDENGVGSTRQLLSQTGLYADIATEQLAPGVGEYQPQFTLWTDTASKHRYLYLPEGTTIDISDIDEWQFPVGTKIWKEFSRDGIRIETRLLEKLPDDRLTEGLDRWLMLAYVWNDTQTEAVATPLGLENASGTQHDVPDQEACNSCHNARREKPLGVSAVQLAHDGPGLNLTNMQEQGMLSEAPSVSLAVPGNDLERSILGYLHANCGHCHRDGARANSRVNSLRMWLESESLESVETSETYTSLVNAYSESSDGSMLQFRISGQDVAGSELLRRITRRGEWQMPPLGTEMVDEDMVAVFEEWIATLPPAE